jgi:1-deoxy-D-xylulose-5-phosphate synthase
VDQLVVAALQKLPVVFALDRAGVVGGDGATHNGSFDYSFLRCVPNMVVMAPADENECRQMLFTACGLDGPAAVRYPRGPGPGVAVEQHMGALPLGQAQLRRRGHGGLLLLSFGTMLEAALAAGERLDATVVNMRFIKPLDVALLRELVPQHSAWVSLEENTVAGGAGSAVAEALAAEGLERPHLHLGLPDRFIEHGSREECLADAGLDSASVAAAIERWWRPQAGGLNSEPAATRISGVARSRPA